MFSTITADQRVEQKVDVTFLSSRPYLNTQEQRGLTDVTHLQRNHISCFWPPAIIA